MLPFLFFLLNFEGFYLDTSCDMGAMALDVDCNPSDDAATIAHWHSLMACIDTRLTLSPADGLVAQKKDCDSDEDTWDGFFHLGGRFTEQWLE